MSACSTLSPKEEKKIKEVKKHHSKIEFQYKKLHQKVTLLYEKVDTSIFLKKKCQNFETQDYQTNSCDFEIMPPYIVYHENNLIFYISSKDIHKLPYPDVTRAYFRINQRKIFLDSLGGSNDSISKYPVNIPSRHRPLPNILRDVSVFSLKDRKFLSCIGSIFINSTSVSRFVFLFDITKPNIPYLLLADYQESADTYCFGDWDSDGNLDYFHKIYRMQETKKLYVRNLKNDVWAIDSTKYIFLEGTFHKQIINVDKSKWYFDLK